MLVATFGNLRWGELAALRRCDVDLEEQTVRVERQLSEARGEPVTVEEPKSDAGRRTVAIPEVIVPDLRWHLKCFARSGDEGLVFASPTGSPLRHSNFRHRVWVKALESAGLSEVRFHDLRHTGNTLMAESGATLRELMERMGHTSTKAALTYLHASSDRHHALAKALSTRARNELKKQKPKKQSGTGVARRRGRAS